MIHLEELQQFLLDNPTNDDIEKAVGYNRKSVNSSEISYHEIIRLNIEGYGVNHIAAIMGFNGSSIHRTFCRLAKMGVYKSVRGKKMYRLTPKKKSAEREAISARVKLVKQANGDLIALAVRRSMGNLAAGAWL